MLAIGAGSFKGHRVANTHTHPYQRRVGVIPWRLLTPWLPATITPMARLSPPLLFSGRQMTFMGATGLPSPACPARVHLRLVKFGEEHVED